MANGAPPRWYSFFYCVAILAACVAGIIYAPWWGKILCVFPALYAIFFLVVTFSSLKFIPRRRK